MISFEAFASLFFILLLIAMSIDFSSETVFFHQAFAELGVKPIGTGLGIVLGNLVINYFKYKNLIKDISKVFNLVVSNQIDDLYNIRMACESIGDRFHTRAQTIISLQDQQCTTEERKGLLKDAQKIKGLGDIIRNDDLYKRKLDDVKLFKSDKLEIIVRYFRKLKIILEDLRNFTSYELPSCIDEFDDFHWRGNAKEISDYYKDRTNFIVARINIVICLGLMTKRIFGSFDMKARNNFDEVYQLLLNREHEIQGRYFILKEDFDIIREFYSSLYFVTECLPKNLMM